MTAGALVAFLRAGKAKKQSAIHFSSGKAAKYRVNMFNKWQSISIWMWVWVSVHVHVPLHPAFECNMHRSMHSPSSQVAINHMYSFLCTAVSVKEGSDNWVLISRQDWHLLVYQTQSYPTPWKPWQVGTVLQAHPTEQRAAEHKARMESKGARWSQRRGSRRRKKKRNQQMGKGNDLFYTYKQTNKKPEERKDKKRRE